MAPQTTNDTLPVERGSLLAHRLQALAQHGGAGLFFVAASLLFHLPAATAHLIPMQDDVKVFYFPLLMVSADALSKGVVPLWSPAILGGYPLFADGEAGMMYPLHLLVLPWLTPEVSLIVLRIVHSLLAGIFAYALLRTLGAGVLGGVVAGLVYGYSGFAVAQLVHTNVFHAMVWLPLELALVEHACQARSSARYRYAVLAGAAMGIQALAVHIQVTLMSALALAAFLGYRGLAGEFRVSGFGIRDQGLEGRNSILDFGLRKAMGLLVTVSILSTVALVGVGIAAVQLIPLYELAQQTYRGSGLGAEAAATNSVWLGGLLTLLLPRLYDTPGGDFWGPWVKWETVLYVGILPMLLAFLGLFTRSGRHWPFFGGLAALSLLLALGSHAPVPLWDMLHALPFFEPLQSPGRFSLLLTLAIAVLAGYGANWLTGMRNASRAIPNAQSPIPNPQSAIPNPQSPIRNPRSPIPIGLAAALAIGATSTLLGAAMLLERASAELRAPSPDTLRLADSYLRLPGVPPTVDGLPLTAEWVARLAADSLALANPATLGQLTLGLASVLVVALLLFGRSRRFPALQAAGAAAAVLLILADFWVLGLTFHPYGRIEDLRAQIPSILVQQSDPRTPYRIYTPPTTGEKRTALEPNRLLAAGIHEAGGYSSLQPDRHIAYARAVHYADNHLLDLWNVRYVVRRNRPELFPSYAGTVFHPQRPMFSGKGLTPGAGGVLLPERASVEASEVRVISSLWDAAALADGAVTARIVLEGPGEPPRTLALRAGGDVSDASMDVPGAAARFNHSRAEVAYRYQRADPRGDRFGEQLYYARLSVEPPMVVSRVTVEKARRVGGLEIFGVGLVDPTIGEVTQVRQKEKHRLVHRDDQVSIYENTAAMPRAFLVGTGTAAPAGRDVLSWMLDGPFDPWEMAILELGPEFQVPSSTFQLSGSAFGTRNLELGTWNSHGRAGTAIISSYKDREVVIQAVAQREAILVLTDSYYPGWVAEIDGRPTPILRTDYLFRGVVVPAGSHVVTFSYRPWSVALGAMVSLGAACAVLAVPALQALALLRGRLPASRRVAVAPSVAHEGWSSPPGARQPRGPDVGGAPMRSGPADG